MSFSKPILLLLVIVLSSSAANAATFTIRNNCPYTVWAASLPSRGVQVNSGQSQNFDFAAGTSAARIWGRTGCSFNGAGQGSCQTGDCNGRLVCQVSGQPPATLAEFTLNGGGNNDYYDISVIDGYNLPMQFSPTNGNCRSLRCTDPNCPDAYHQPNDVKTFSCPSGTNYNVIFCP